ncbi:MAG: DUF2911 domain-containing protein [Bacteroidota bacterium]
MLKSLLFLLLLVGLSARAQDAPPPAFEVAEIFVVEGFRLGDEVPPGSAVGRAGLRYADGGYVHVVHGKPYVRGRQVYGGLVGYGAVWAAGAHRATELVTTVPLTVGDTRVEPGAYSLFVTPGRDRWTLHVNRALGMHLADEYDAALDVATVEVAPEMLATPVEGLTWSFADDGTALRFAWADVAIAVPFERTSTP